MRSVYKLSASLLLVISLYSTSIYADWGSFLEDLATAGKELLSSNSESSTELDYDTIVSGLKEALDIGTRHAVDNVSQVDGYLANELIRIAMPSQLQQVTDLMRKFCLSGQEDANTILQGDDDAATQYFRDKTTTQLTELFRPTIENSLNQVGTTQYYNDLAG